MLQDHFHDSINVVEYIIVPESQNQETLLAQPSVALSIIGTLVGMLSSV
jgi:hypothetical protein